MSAERIVLLARDSASSRLLFHALSARFAVHAVLEQPPGALSLLRSRARRLGWIEVLGQVLFMALLAKPMALASRSRNRRIIQEHGGSDAPIPTDRITRVSSVNRPECWEAVGTHDPKVVVINGTRILSPRAIEALGRPILNTHVGITPRYRGVHGAYWALAQGDAAHCGVTIHLVDAGVDTGAILHQARILPTADDNFTTYPTLQMAVAVPLLVKAVEEVIAGRAQPREASGPSRRWNHPTLWAYISNRVRRGAR